MARQKKPRKAKGEPTPSKHERLRRRGALRDLRGPMYRPGDIAAWAQHLEQGLSAAQLVERCRDADARELVVCDRCGLVQPFDHSNTAERLAPCAGPLGLHCPGETASFLDDEQARAA